MTTLPKLLDPLGDALHFLHMSGVFYCRSEFTAPWGLALPPFEHCLMFHMVTEGECWIEIDGVDPYHLKVGELALIPHGAGHQLTSTPGQASRKLFDIEREQISERYEILRLGGGGASTIAICGVVQFDTPAALQLVRLLPRLLTVGAWERAGHTEWIHQTLRIMSDEAQEPRPGGEAVITRLADVLVIQAIRAWISRDPSAKTGWLGALQDKQIGRAIAQIHRHPGHVWTLASLGSSVGMSRSAFAERFTALVGESAMQYVLRWRMQTALGWLKDQRVSVSDAAHQLGYASEASFSRAFKQVIGFAPGTARRQSNASPNK